MNVVTGRNAIADSVRSEKFHLWRSRKDTAVRWLIAIGGVGVIWAVVLIFFYLLWVVFPLFVPAHAQLEKARSMPAWEKNNPVYFSIEEQREIGLRLTDDGEAGFFHVPDGRELTKVRLPVTGTSRITTVTESVEQDGKVAVATNDGHVYVFRHRYETSFSAGVDSREIKPVVDFPYGEGSLLELPFPAISGLAFSDSENEFVVAAIGPGGRVRVNYASKSENFITGEVTVENDFHETSVGFNATTVAVSGNHRWLYIGDNQGRVYSFTLPALEAREVVQAGQGAITSMAMLLGGISVLAGDSNGGVSQLFPVRDENNRFKLQLIRQFEGSGSPVAKIVPEQRRKGFLALDTAQHISVYHSTAGRRILQEDLGGLQPRGIALAPRANGLLIEGAGGSLQMLQLENEHPEVSFSSIWRKVWYENYEQPEYIWQSSASTNEFEPKFSLTPLVFGTIKASFYAMLFAIPLALMGAAYTAYFMSPQLRKWVKPGIEIMAALPTVILGFLAGLWFAPWMEEHLADLFLMMLIIPPGLVVFAWAWHKSRLSDRMNIPEGWEPLLLIPTLLGLGALAMWIADPVQATVFGGDMRDWLSNEAGISYDQRNAMVVGCAMGFAVIPTIFSIAEDAVFGVPESLSQGSLALGATPWQTMVFVILPTASPGIFSALMIGLGRAVGETMIVLMATGNTPIMDWNLFEGMRTLAANIAVEMPESEVNSSHYRILFLAGLVLFIFTFVVNTGAELIRQRLREKYSSL
ncbi:MAG: ABC transporter permease subunit [Xanthomonadales bacterium]|jgi:phosphate transport system permease protein|nr:ABC transporter permease subunit [Xanthomonadales bacterium]